MKRIVVCLLFLVGCSSVPYSVEMINVGDELTYQRPHQPMIGCVLKVENIITVWQNAEDGSFFKDEHVCGLTTSSCSGGSRRTCIEFESFRMDRPSRETHERP